MASLGSTPGQLPTLLGQGMHLSVRNTFLHVDGSEDYGVGGGQVRQPGTLMRSKTMPVRPPSDVEDLDDIRDSDLSTGEDAYVTGQTPRSTSLSERGDGEELEEDYPPLVHSVTYDEFEFSHPFAFAVVDRSAGKAAPMPSMPLDWRGSGAPAAASLPVAGEASHRNVISELAGDAVQCSRSPEQATNHKANGRGGTRQKVPKTTIMLRNLPNNYSRDMLLDLIDAEGFAAHVDFLYFPIDFKTRAALGYAFVNLVTPDAAEEMRRHFDGFSNWCLPSAKVCHVSWSDPYQGLEANIARYRNSPLMHDSVPEGWRPVIFAGGVRVPFPPNTKKVKPPRQGTERVLF